MNDLRDNLIIVTLCRNGHPKDKETYDRYIGRAKDVAMKNHIPVFRIYTDFVQVEDDVTGALCSLSNAHAIISACLLAPSSSSSPSTAPITQLGPHARHP